MQEAKLPELREFRARFEELAKDMPDARGRIQAYSAFVRDLCRELAARKIPAQSLVGFAPAARVTAPDGSQSAGVLWVLSLLPAEASSIDTREKLVDAQLAVWARYRDVPISMDAFRAPENFGGTERDLFALIAPAGTSFILAAGRPALPSPSAA